MTEPEDRPEKLRLTELGDRAQAAQGEINDAAIAASRRAMEPESHPDFDGSHCVDGGELIPKARLLMGKIRCVDCQEDLERARKLRGR